jgi:DNA polymerase-3 subunit epsilon
MTRGQDSLMIEDDTVRTEVAVAGFNRDGLRLVVLRATSGEVAAHEAQLADIDKASGGAVWTTMNAE